MTAARAQTGAAGGETPLRVGAARVDVTPAVEDLPDGWLGIHDRIHSRAIVVSDGRERVALVTVDMGGFRNEMAERIQGRIARATGIAADHVFLTATHTHSVPFRIGGEAFEAAIVESVVEAESTMELARVGYGEGASYLNVNRNRIDPETRRWWEGPNRDGPSDKTVAVVLFETLDGDPIAVYYNYAMHAVLVGMMDKVSGDVPGAASRYIEDSFDDEVVAVWSTGASGDQNPLYFQQTYDLREIRIAEYAARGVDIRNQMPPGGQGLDRTDPAVARLMNQQTQLVASMGQLLGEEVKTVMREIDRTAASPRIRTAQAVVSCPGRRRLDEGRAGAPGVYADADPVSMTLGLITLGDIALTAVNGEVFNPIWTRLRRASPYANVLMATLTNGYAETGYIPHDAAFGQYTFEVVSSRLQPGCAETAIVDGLLDLMEEVRP